VFDHKSAIEPSTDDLKIKSQGFSFNTIDEINNFEQMKTIDVIGCIT
jgi:hypothetical protein